MTDFRRRCFRVWLWSQEQKYAQVFMSVRASGCQKGMQYRVFVPCWLPLQVQFPVLDFVQDLLSACSGNR